MPPVPPATDRRSAIWPWFVMPAAAIALFVTLHTVRHASAAAAQSGARASAQSAASTQ